MPILSSEKVQVVIVNYKSADLTIRCVESIAAHAIAALQNVIIVDNKSPDNSYDRLSLGLPDADLVSASANNGYGAGVNFGAARAKTDYLLVLNPDTYFEFDSITIAQKLMDSDSRIGIVGLDLVNPDGTRQFSARRFYSFVDVIARRFSSEGGPLAGRIDRHLMKDVWMNETPFDAEWVMGTGFLIRRDLFNRIGGMDEKYFLYMEDVDLCARVWKEGYRVVCIPGAELVHDHQRSSARPFSPAGLQHMASLWRFMRKFRVPIFASPGIEKVTPS